jgi:mxaD protein
MSANPDLLWEAIGGFGAIGEWHPLIKTLSTTGDGVGATRVVESATGARSVERLLDAPPGAHRYRYTMESTSLPLRDHVAELAVRDNGDGTSTVEWSSEFKVTGGDEAETVQHMHDFMATGLEHVKKAYEG